MKKKTLLSCLGALAVGTFGLGFASVTHAEPAPDTTLRPLVHYEFRDEANPGKDSSGNFDLTVRDCKDMTGGAITVENGAATFDGKKVLYSEPISGAMDFSDYVTSFTYSFWVSTDVTDGTVFAGGGGWRGGGLSIEMKKTNIWVRAGTNDTFMEAPGLDLSTPTHVTVTADKEKGTAALYVGGELIASKTGLTSDKIFMSFNPDSYFAVGGEVHRADATSSFIGTLKDVRLYDCALSESNISALSENKEATSGNETKKAAEIQLPSYPVKIKKNSTAGLSVLAQDLPAALTVTDSDKGTHTSSVLWRDLTKNENGAIITGVAIGSGLAGTQNLPVSVAVSYATGEEAVPLVHYEFRDEANPGKDSSGNFDLTVRDCKDMTGGAITVENGAATFDGKKVLYSEPISGAMDFSDYVTSFTYSFWVSTDVTDGTVFAGGGGWRGGGLSIEMKKTNIWVRAGTNDTFMEAPGLDLSTPTHVTVTADKEKGTAALYVGGELIASKTGLTSDKIFMSFNPDSYFAVGGEVHRADATSSFIGTLKDIRLYDCALPATSVYDLAQSKETLTDEYAGSAVKDPVTYEGKNKVSENATAETLAISLPDTLNAQLSDGSTAETKVLWKKSTLVKNTDERKFTMNGILLGIANLSRIEAIASIPYAKDENILPLAWYFTDEAYTKDRRGNFRLSEMDVVGKTDGKIETNSGVVSFDGKKALYSAPIEGVRDFTDYLNSYSVAFVIQPTDAIGVALSAGWYGGLLVECGVVDGVGHIFVRAGDESTFMETSFDCSKPVHFVITADKQAGRTALYLDGKLIAQKTTDADKIFMSYEDTLLAFGARVQNKETLNTDSPFTGMLSDVRIYDFALDAYAAENVYKDRALSETGTAAVLENAFKAAVPDTSGVDLVVGETNTEEVILAQLPAKLALGDAPASILWYKIENGSAYGLIYATEAVNVSGLTARVRLSYTLTASGGGVVTFDENPVHYGDTVSFKVELPAYSEPVSVKAGETELTADAQGKYSFVYTGQEIYAEVRFLPQSIHYVLNGGALPEGTPEEYTADTGITLEIPTREGYFFDGWFAEENFGGAAVTAIPSGEGGERTYYAKWTKFIRLDYIVDGGTLSEDALTVLRVTETYDLPVPTKEGYTFGGWFADKDYGGAALTKLENPENDLTLYAKWNIKEYTITFLTQGGSEVAAQKVAHGQLITIPEPPVKEGCRFLGWFADEEGTSEFSLYNPVEGDVTLYAKWEALPHEKVGCKNSCGSSLTGAGISAAALAVATALVCKKRKKL